MTPADFGTRKAAACSGLLLLWAMPGLVRADTAASIGLGYSYTDNLEVQTPSAGEGSGDLSRQGSELLLSLSRQSLDFDGGWGVNATASYNRGIAGGSDTGNDITNASASAMRLLALSPAWLLRAAATARYLDNEPLPLNSYSGVSASTTLGYLGKRASGIDIGLRIKRENHREVANDRYDTTRSRLSLTHYFSHARNAPGVSVTGALTRNNATVVSRDYTAYSLGATIRQWKVGRARLQVGVESKWDFYEKNSAGVVGAGPGMRNAPGDGVNRGDGGMQGTAPDGTSVVMSGAVDNTVQRREDLTLFSFIALSHRLRNGLWLKGDFSAGVYSSNLGDGRERFFAVSFRLVHDF